MMRFAVAGMPSQKLTVSKRNSEDPQYFMYNGFTLAAYDKAQTIYEEKVATFEFSKEQEEAFYEWLKARHEYRETHEEPKYEYERDESFNISTSL